MNEMLTTGILSEDSIKGRKEMRIKGSPKDIRRIMNLKVK